MTGAATAPDWRIRSCDEDDVAALALVGGATFLETFAGVIDGRALVAHCTTAHSADTYRHYLEEGGKGWLAEASKGGAPIGYALLTPPGDIPGAEPGDLELKRIYALSRFHGTGLGAALMQKAHEAARDGARRLLLGVYANNARALAFYRKQGFTDIGERRFNVGGRVYDDRVLALPLN